MINVGLIGLGYWGSKLLRVLDQNANVVFASSHNNRKSEIEKKYPNINFAINDYENLISQPNVEAIIIATPTKHHIDIIEICAKYKKHVFVEKPLASNLQECNAIKRFFPKNRILFVGHIFLHHPCYKKLIEHIGKGNILNIFASWSKLGTFENNFLLELLPHDISLGLDIFNKIPIKIKKLYSSNITSKIDHLFIELKYSKIQKYTIELNRVSNLKRRFMRIGTRDGKTFLWENNEILFFNKNTNNFELFFNSEEEPLNNEIQNFLSCIKNNHNKSDISFSSNVISIINDIDSRVYLNNIKTKKNK